MKTPAETGGSEAGTIRRRYNRRRAEDAAEVPQRLRRRRRQRREEPAGEAWRRGANSGLAACGTVRMERFWDSAAAEAGEVAEGRGGKEGRHLGGMERG